MLGLCIERGCGLVQNEDVRAAQKRAGERDALFLPGTRARFRSLLNLGLTDALRATSDEPGLYTFWDYQAGAWQRNKGIRIDHLLLSPRAADRLADTAADTRAAMTGLAVLGVAALAVALIALVIAVRKD